MGHFAELVKNHCVVVGVGQASETHLCAKLTVIDFHSWNKWHLSLLLQVQAVSRLQLA